MKYNAGVHASSEDWLNLHRNENLFIEEQMVKNIVLEAVNEISIRKYPDPNATNLREALANRHGVSPENIFVGNGADEVLSSLFYLYRKKFKEINYPRIGFKMYDTLASKYDFKVNQFQNFPELHSIPESSGLFVIDSPSSITGNVIDRSKLENLVSNKENIVIWDNVHGDFCNDDLKGIQSDNLIIVKHFSHYYALASLRIGYCIASKAIVDEMNVYREPFSVNSVAQAAAIGCLANRDYFDSISEEIKIVKDEFEKRLHTSNFQICKSVVNFILIKHKTVDSQFIHDELIARKIVTRYYADDEILHDYLRIAIPPQSRLDNVIVAIQEIISGRK